MRGLGLLGWGAILLLAACQPLALATPDLPNSAWGLVMTLDQAEQMSAPVLRPLDDRLLAGWIADDVNGTYQAVALMNSSGISQQARLPLPVYPYAQQMVAASGDLTLLTWLDANVNRETRLWATLLTPNLEQERELIPISDEATRRYTLVSATDGATWAISVGGLLSEPTLFARFVDAEGRPRLEDIYEIARDADWPSAIRTANDTVMLYWLRVSDNRIMRSPLIDGRLEQVEDVVEGAVLQPGDRLESFHVAQDRTHIYLFWNITRADDRRESWFTAAPPGAAEWLAPVRIGITASDVSFETGFNGGSGLTAQQGSISLSWITPLSEPFDRLPAAALIDQTTLAVVYFQGGTLVGYQPVIEIDGLLAAPTFRTDRDRHLHLAWAEVGTDTPAAMRLTSTRWR